LSDRSSKPQRSDNTGPLPALQPRPRTTGTFVPWKTVAPRRGEAVRWQCVDGRTITVELGQGEHVGLAKVTGPDDRYEYVDSFEAALELAQKWRTT
jgi:hypothetical protein